MKILIAFAIATLALNAHAGSSATRLSCSSYDGRVALVGYLPGQGEEDIDLHIANRGELMTYTNANGGGAKAEVKLLAKKHSVEITVSAQKQMIKIVSNNATKVISGFAGTEGSFVGELTGTDPAQWARDFKAPVQVRCYVSDTL